MHDKNPLSEVSEIVQHCKGLPKKWKSIVGTLKCPLSNVVQLANPSIPEVLHCKLNEQNDPTVLFGATNNNNFY